MARPRTRSPSELLVELRSDSAVTLRRQLEVELRTSIQAGRLRPGTTLPSTRVLAEQLDVSRGVVVDAYEQLVAEGYLTSLPRGATRVAAGVMPDTSPDAAVPTSTSIRISFFPPRPDLTEFPRRAWLRSVRRTIESASVKHLDYPEPGGVPELRSALAAYLNRVRGTAATPERVVVCTGHAQAMDLVVQLIKADRGRRIAVEDPGYPPASAAIRRHGLEPIGIPVDDGGIDVTALLAADVQGVFLTPAHQLPTGVVLAPERRASIVRWAAAVDALVLEDDYDAEYRYDRQPVGALQGLAPEQIVFVGTTSKTLSPALRLGWMVLPKRYVEPATAAKSGHDRGSPGLEQLAFADFLEQGELDRHLRRTRPLYGTRRHTLLDAFRRHAPDLEPTGASAGLQITAWLRPDIDDGEVARAAAPLGVSVGALSSLYVAGVPARPGLLFGYAPLHPREIDEGVRIVAKAIRAVV